MIVVICYLLLSAGTSLEVSLIHSHWCPSLLVCRVWPVI